MTPTLMDRLVRIAPSICMDEDPEIRSIRFDTYRGRKVAVVTNGHVLSGVYVDDYAFDKPFTMLLTIEQIKSFAALVRKRQLTQQTVDVARDDPHTTYKDWQSLDLPAGTHTLDVKRSEMIAALRPMIKAYTAINNEHKRDRALSIAYKAVQVAQARYDALALTSLRAEDAAKAVKAAERDMRSLRLATAKHIDSVECLFNRDTVTINPKPREVFAVKSVKAPVAWHVTHSGLAGDPLKPAKYNVFWLAKALSRLKDKTIKLRYNHPYNHLELSDSTGFEWLMPTSE